jgi:hypothetical protein
LGHQSGKDLAGFLTLIKGIKAFQRHNSLTLFIKESEHARWRDSVPRDGH